MRKQRSEQEKQDIIKLYQSGLNITAVSKQVKCKKSTINLILQEAKVLRYSRMTEVIKDAIKKDYKNGISLIELTEKYNYSLQAINRFLHLEKVKRHSWKGRSLNQNQIDELVQLWKDGEPMSVLKSKINRSEPTIMRYLKKAGEKPRRKGWRSSGDKHPSWKGGRSISGEGYVLFHLKPDNPYYCMVNSLGYILEHRYVVAQKMGRPLEKWETVHHIDGNKQNNKIENLQLRIGRHGKGETYKCNCCGSTNVSPVDL